MAGTNQMLENQFERNKMAFQHYYQNHICVQASYSICLQWSKCKKVAHFKLNLETFERVKILAMLAILVAW